MNSIEEQYKDEVTTILNKGEITRSLKFAQKLLDNTYAVLWSPEDEEKVIEFMEVCKGLLENF